MEVSNLFQYSSGGGSFTPVDMQRSVMRFEKGVHTQVLDMIWKKPSLREAGMTCAEAA